MDHLTTTCGLRLLAAATELQARLSGEFAAVHGLSLNEFLLLLQLERSVAKRLSRVELSRRMHVSASTITRMAAPMEKVGLLAREPHARDARLAFVVITEAGRTKLGEARVTFAKQADGFFADRWTDPDLDQLAALLHRLVPAGAPGLA